MMVDDAPKSRKDCSSNLARVITWYKLKIEKIIHHHDWYSNGSPKVNRSDQYEKEFWFNSVFFHRGYPSKKDLAIPLCDVHRMAKQGSSQHPKGKTEPWSWCKIKSARFIPAVSSHNPLARQWLWTEHYWPSPSLCWQELVPGERSEWYIDQNSNMYTYSLSWSNPGKTHHDFILRRLLEETSWCALPHWRTFQWQKLLERSIGEKLHQLQLPPPTLSGSRQTHRFPKLWDACWDHPQMPTSMFLTLASHFIEMTIVKSQMILILTSI